MTRECSGSCWYFGDDPVAVVLLDLGKLSRQWRCVRILERGAAIRRGRIVRTVRVHEVNPEKPGRLGRLEPCDRLVGSGLVAKEPVVGEGFEAAESLAEAVLDRAVSVERGRVIAGFGEGLSDGRQAVGKLAEVLPYTVTVRVT